MADDDRTLPATERRRQQARSEGQAPLSREVLGATGLAVAALLLIMAGPSLVQSLQVQLAAMLRSDQTPEFALRAAGSAVLMTVIPVACAVSAAVVLSSMLQTGWLVHTQALMPDLTRLSPGRGIKRVFGTRNAIETVKSVLKVAVLGWAFWHVMSRAIGTITQSLTWTLPTVVAHLAREIGNVMGVALGFQVVLALLDVLWSRYELAKSLRMSPQEVKQEHREQEGDPRLKAKFKQVRAARARRRMLAAVARATVVVTNPTHFAVALSYQRGSASAPTIVAKGVDEVAARIRAAAQAHRVPLFPNPPLARALHELPLDSEVPPEHFKAVAEIIAWIWRVRQGARAVA